MNVHPNSLKNLVRFENLTSEEHAEISRKGGKKSAKIRAEKRKMKDILKVLLSIPVMCEGEERSSKEAMLVKVVQKAVNEGDLKSIEFIRNTIGENPAQRIEDVNMNIEVVDQKAIDVMTKKIKQKM